MLLKIIEAKMNQWKIIWLVTVGFQHTTINSFIEIILDFSN